MKIKFPSRSGRAAGASRNGASVGFTLVELLTVMGIAALMLGISIPAIQGLFGAGSVNRAIGDLSGALELGRTYARANHTYVRVALAQVPAGAGHATPQVAVLLLYSADGQLDNQDPSDMANPAEWPAIRPPIFLQNLVFNDSLNGVSPDTSLDEEPSQTDISPLSAQAPAMVSGISFNYFVQFNPSGEAQVKTSEPARNIKLALDKPGSQHGQNPFILRLSGMNGTIVVLRKEDM